jgi:hypothetical protein
VPVGSPATAVVSRLSQAQGDGRLLSYAEAPAEGAAVFRFAGSSASSRTKPTAAGEDAHRVAQAAKRNSLARNERAPLRLERALIIFVGFALHHRRQLEPSSSSRSGFRRTAPNCWKSPSRSQFTWLSISLFSAMR